MDALGFMNLTLVTTPVLKNFKNPNGGTVDYWELTLTDGTRIFNKVSGEAHYDFSLLSVGTSYSFGVIPRVKNINAVAQNGTQYNKAYNDFKVVGVFDNIDISKLPLLKVIK